MNAFRLNKLAGPGAVLCLVAVAPFALALRGPPVAAGEEVVIMVPPWEDAAVHVHAAEGGVAHAGRLPFIAATYALDHAFAARLAARVRVLYFDAGLASALCKGGEADAV